MATAPVLDFDTAPTNLAIVAKNPGIVLLDNEKFDRFYAKLKAEADAVPVDLATKKGRDAIASIAAKVRSEKAGIDKDRLRLTKEWRDLTSQVNGAWKGIEERLTGLAVEVRAPLTAWENAEKARVDSCREDIEAFKRAGIVSLSDTAEMVRERGTDLWGQPIDPERFGDMAGEAQAAKAASVETLKAALARLTREEADRAELDKLRAEAAEHAAREAAEQEATQRAAEEAAAIQRLKDQQERDEKQAAEALAAAERAAEQRARDAAEKAAQVERDRVQAEHDAAIAAERAKADAERAAIEEERASLARIENERKAKEEQERRAIEQLAAEQTEREKNKAHRTRVKTAAKQAIMTCGVSEDAAQKVVLAIIAREIPAVTLAF